MGELCERPARDGAGGVALVAGQASVRVGDDFGDDEAQPVGVKIRVRPLKMGFGLLAQASLLAVAFVQSGKRKYRGRSSGQESNPR